jgi:hypothetical protein
MAVDHFNLKGGRHTWLHYLPAVKAPEFFETLRGKLIDRLKEWPVLESLDGSLRTPASLVCLHAKEFADDKATPFLYTLRPDTKSRYLSRIYTQPEMDAIRALDVRELSPGEFLQDLTSAINSETHARAFQNKQSTWHSQLANALSLLAMEKKHMACISELRIVPLQERDRNAKTVWVSAAGGRTIFFSGAANHTDESYNDLPDDIQIAVVDHHATRDDNRRRLFAQLGVKTYDVSQICRLILEKHADSSAKSLPQRSLVSHARFLFRADWKNQGKVDLWFATAKDERAQGSSLYVEQNPNRATNLPRTVFNHIQKKDRFIHMDYFGDCQQETRRKWVEWFCQQFSLSTCPRLVSPLSSSTFDLSDDFTSILDTCPITDVLRTLRDNWRHYAKWIEDDNDELRETESSKRKLRNSLAQRVVMCRNGRKYPLAKTCLPSIDNTLDEILCTPSLEIDDRKNKGWGILTNFGVTVARDIRFYFLCLFNLRESRPPKKTVGYIYQQIQVELDRSGDVDLVRYERIFFLFNN